MRRSRSLAAMRAAATLMFALTHAVLTAHAADTKYPVDKINFGSDAISFGTSGIAFPSSPLVTETATTVEVTLPADVLFDFDKADIRAEAQPALHELAGILKAKARGPVTIQGHTDGKGDDAYNQKLSERRAASVKAWLATREGLSMAMTPSGSGARSPVAPNLKKDGTDDPDGRQLNRRVTIVYRK